MRRGCEISVVGWLQIRAAACRGRCQSQPFATKERYGCGSAACRYTSARWEVTSSPQLPVKTGISCGRTESSAPTEDRGSKTARRGRRLCRPKKYNEFAGIYRKNALFCRVDATPAGQFRGAAALCAALGHRSLQASRQVRAYLAALRTSSRYTPPRPFRSRF